MPEQSTPLANDREVVDVALAGLYGALSNIGRPICPSTLQLSYSMPAMPSIQHKQKKSELEKVGPILKGLLPAPTTST